MLHVCLAIERVEQMLFIAVLPNSMFVATSSWHICKIKSVTDSHFYTFVPAFAGFWQIYVIHARVCWKRWEIGRRKSEWLPPYLLNQCQALVFKLDAPSPTSIMCTTKKIVRAIFLRAPKFDCAIFATCAKSCTWVHVNEAINFQYSATGESVAENKCFLMRTLWLNMKRFQPPKFLRNENMISKITDCLAPVI